MPWRVHLHTTRRGVRSRRPRIQARGCTRVPTCGRPGPGGLHATPRRFGALASSRSRGSGAARRGPDHHRRDGQDPLEDPGRGAHDPRLHPARVRAQPGPLPRALHDGRRRPPHPHPGDGGLPARQRAHAADHHRGGDQHRPCPGPHADEGERARPGRDTSRVPHQRRGRHLPGLLREGALPLRRRSLPHSALSPLRRSLLRRSPRPARLRHSPDDVRGRRRGQPEPPVG